MWGERKWIGRDSTPRHVSPTGNENASIDDLLNQQKEVKAMQRRRQVACRAWKH